MLLSQKEKLTRAPEHVQNMINLPEGPPQPGPGSPAVKKELATLEALILAKRPAKVEAGR